MKYPVWKGADQMMCMENRNLLTCTTLRVNTSTALSVSPSDCKNFPLLSLLIHENLQLFPAQIHV
jgi:hypothetical protein